MKKEEPAVESIGMTAFDYPNNENPKPHAPIYYGNQHVPKPTNEKAKMVNPSAIVDSFTKRM
jgi:hypothetical protein